jgi:hypothetical protein
MSYDITAACRRYITPFQAILQSLQHAKRVEAAVDLAVRLEYQPAPGAIDNFLWRRIQLGLMPFDGPARIPTPAAPACLRDLLGNRPYAAVPARSAGWCYLWRSVTIR